MKKRNGLLALLGLGAYAFWKYKKMPASEQDKIKQQFDDAKRKITDTGKELKSKAENKINKVSEEVPKRSDEFQGPTVN